MIFCLISYFTIASAAFYFNSGEQNSPLHAHVDMYCGLSIQADPGVNSPELHPHNANLGFQLTLSTIAGISLLVSYHILRS